MNNDKYEKIKDIILNLYNTPGSFQTSIDGVKVGFHTAETNFINCFYSSSAIFVIQGAKETVCGNSKFHYERGEHLLTAIDIPVASKIASASKEEPFVVIIINLNYTIIRSLVRELNLSATTKKENFLMGCTKTDDSLLDALYRLAQLLQKSEDEQKILSPLIIKEIHYRLLTGEYGECLINASTKNTKANRVIGAIDIITRDFNKTLDMEKVASEVLMCPSLFYKTFKEATNISPLQFQKHLKLNEAQRLLLTGEYDVISVAYQVGYKSPAQFNRDYKRHFGSSPKQNVKDIMLE